MFNVGYIIGIWKQAAEIMTIKELEAAIKKFDKNTHPTQKDIFKLELRIKKTEARKRCHRA